MAQADSPLGHCPHCGQSHVDDVLVCPATDKLLPLPGRVLDGKFRFVKQLGEGGMGSVWKAENVLVKRHVAIKLIHSQFARDEAVLARFRNEATAAGRIGSKHICDILDFGKSTLGPYIVMEMLRGSDLAGLVERQGPLDAKAAVGIVRQALVGLGAAHEAGIVHRDLKPENVFLHEPEPGQLMVKLMDFGISKFTEGHDGGRTGVGVLMGTPGYMSPEQTEGAATVDHRADLWAMGVMLYWAISGQNPFDGPTLAATLMNVTMRDVPPLSAAVPGVPAGLSEAIARCLCKDPRKRWPSAAAFNDALARVGVAESGGRASSDNEPGFTLGTGTVLQAGSGESGSDTWSGNLMAARGETGHSLRSGGDWSAADASARPRSNMRGGRAGWVLLSLLAIVAASAGGMAWYAARRGPSKAVPTPVLSAGESGQKSAIGDGETGKGPPDMAGEDASPSNTSGAVADEGVAPVKSPEPGTDVPSPSPTKPRPRADPPKPKPKPATPPPDPNKVRDAGRVWVKRGKRKFSDHAGARGACTSASSSRFEGRRGWRLPRAQEAKSVLAGERNGAFWLSDGRYFNANARAIRSGRVLGGAYAVCVVPK